MMAGFSSARLGSMVRSWHREMNLLSDMVFSLVVLLDERCAVPHLDCAAHAREGIKQDNGIEFVLALVCAVSTLVTKNDCV
jgi:hypothetical protein